MVKQELLNKFDDGLVFDLPGYGSKKDDCGAPVYLAHLSGEKLHWITRSKSCHRKECPVCWPDWKKREALAISDRIGKYYKQTGRMPVHYVLSPPQSISYETKAAFKNLRHLAYRRGRLRGIKGGVMVFHERAIRYTDTDSDTYIKAHCSTGPHFHIIGDGWLSRVREFFLEDGWIVKNLRLRKLNHVYKTAFYILDHAAIPHGYPAISQSKTSELSSVTWFGTMSYNKLKVEDYKGSDKIYCPICELELDRSEWYKVSWNGLGPPPDSKFGEADQGKDGFFVDYPVTEWSGFYQ